MLQVTTYDETIIRITDSEDNEIIYDGPKNIDCIIEAMAFYFGVDEIEHREAELKEYQKLTQEQTPQNVSVQINSPKTQPQGEDYPDDD